MDLLDFDAQPLYFDEPLPEAVMQLIEQAAELYGEPEAEALLTRAHETAPEHLVVQVARYRYYFYTHRLAEAETVAWHVIALVATRLDLPLDGRRISLSAFGHAVAASMTLTRFYLSALKAVAYLKMRRRDLAGARVLLENIVALDPADRLGCQVLLRITQEYEDAEDARDTDHADDHQRTEAGASVPPRPPGAVVRNASAFPIP